MSGPECCENPPAIASGGESGEVMQIASLSSYVSGNPDSKIAVLLVSDVYGYGAPKLRKLADKIASAGYYVVVPDFFNGHPFIPKTVLQDWLKNHPTKQGVDFAKPLIQALKEKGICKIGAAGFCWGAKVVVELAKDADIQVAALLHPTFVTLDDIKGVKVPVAILGAEFDKISPPEVVTQFEAALQAKPEVDHFVKIYPGVSHGWTVRYRDDDIATVKSAQEAHQDLVDWLGKCLHTAHSALFAFSLVWIAEDDWYRNSVVRVELDRWSWRYNNGMVAPAFSGETIEGERERDRENCKSNVGSSDQIYHSLYALAALRRDMRWHCGKRAPISGV